ncbi:SemiSWEET transporter [Dolichospermum circinale CS-1225]|jgi:MtN3 and saliva related transmembrane protein|uniref:SemiSWEET transporter n=2 Tax=Dolichospermum TaxID=748770 RepID=A0ABT5AH33_9CYAN|nr:MULTISPECIES: SemiSWEET transporter [Dolichospermum]MDB9457455.1 SemiSWEET transporter [Dolichospermum circinale CS-545/17]MDB9481124.1 SemiSWEET transporter [Dolichospermum circinale CS-537/05]MBD2445136.1 SemiSWEET transporter [Dolichospermum sp. FACHB-1091]MCW9682004.1 SemiSWEET transporter [Dolichospermum planctonicum UHCC 0167]MDB9476311.1 SemiSWEET transporter [Dolichospermum circinale CS-537/11]
MDFITILGLVAGVLTTVAFLPQMFQIWLTKSAKDVSFVMLIIFMSGLCLWLIYGIIIGALPIIMANGVTLFFNLIILWLKIKYR